MHVPPTVQSMCWFVFDTKWNAVNDFYSQCGTRNLVTLKLGKYFSEEMGGCLIMAVSTDAACVGHFYVEPGILCRILYFCIEPGIFVSIRFLFQFSVMIIYDLWFRISDDRNSGEGARWSYRWLTIKLFGNMLLVIRHSALIWISCQGLYAHCSPLSCLVLAGCC